MKLITRKKYLEELINVQNTPDIKVITGIRRSGKSKLLEAFIKKLEEKDKKGENNIIKINFNLMEFENLREYHALHNYIESQYKKNKKNYLFIDEVQMCEGFEKAINSLHAQEKYDIYITGSNAFLLSSDLATLFTGRTYQIQVFPFSFSEYSTYFKSEDKETLFKNYFEEGGMAGSYLYDNLKAKYNYLNNDVLNALVVRDILSKYKIRNENLLNKIINYLMDNIGNITSIRNIAKIFESEKVKISDKTISLYIDYLSKAFLFYKVPRYDIQGKRYLRAQDKFYAIDHAFRYARLGMKNLNYGRTLENIVATELLRRGYEIYSGTLNDKEIDFVAINRDEKIYIQVSDDVSKKETFEREVTSFLKIRDAYPKILITHTKHPYIYEGIYVCDITEFLQKENFRVDFGDK